MNRKCGFFFFHNSFLIFLDFVLEFFLFSLSIFSRTTTTTTMMMTGHSCFFFCFLDTHTHNVCFGFFFFDFFQYFFLYTNYLIEKPFLDLKKSMNVCVVCVCGNKNKNIKVVGCTPIAVAAVIQIGLTFDFPCRPKTTEKH